MSNLKPPKMQPQDLAYETGLAVIESVLGPVGKLFKYLVSSPLEKRHQAWMQEVGAAISQLQENNESFNLRQLAENEEFLSVVLHATQIALRNHQQEKINALRNAVLNTALNFDIDIDLKMTFLHHIDTLTPTHIKILSILDNRQKIIEIVNSPSNVFDSITNIQGVLNAILGGKIGDDPFIELVLEELESRKMVVDNITSDFGEALNGQKVVPELTKPFGVLFLRFISDPEIN